MISASVENVSSRLVLLCYKQYLLFVGFLFSSDQPETLATFTGYSLSEIVPCLTDLHKACLDVPHCQLQAIKEKYKRPK